MSQIAPALFAVAILAAGYLIVLCATPPNPSPEKKDRHSTDRISWIAGSFATVSRRLSMAMIMFHALLALLRAYAPEQMPQLCRQPQNLEPTLFSWSVMSTVSLLMMYAGAFVRLAAFRGLGQSFTFHLAAPDQLITTGVYRWIQHPSYSGILMIIVGNLGLFIRWDATPGCFVAESTLSRFEGWGLSILAVSYVAGTSVLMMRVRDEEEMLRQKFGKKWEEWHRSTKRFFPGLA